MFSGTKKYLMDANAIRSLKTEVIASKLDSLRILSVIPDIKYEVAGLTEKLALMHDDSLSSDIYSVAKDILVRDSVTKVVDYYNNKGTADVMLLAHALTVSGVGMFRDEIIVVTNDGNLRLACDDLNLAWMSVEKFSEL